MVKTWYMEASEAKLKKQEGIIDILMEEVKRLKAELVKYKLIKELVNNESENFLVEREDNKRVKDREKEALVQNPIKIDKIKKIKRTRKGISNEEALKHSKPSKKKDKVICEYCGGEYFTSHFHSHYASHIK